MNHQFQSKQKFESTFSYMLQDFEKILQVGLFQDCMCYTEKQFHFVAELYARPQESVADCIVQSGKTVSCLASIFQSVFAVPTLKNEEEQSTKMGLGAKIHLWLVVDFLSKPNFSYRVVQRHILMCQKLSQKFLPPSKLKF